EKHHGTRIIILRSWGFSRNPKSGGRHGLYPAFTHSSPINPIIAGRKRCYRTGTARYRENSLFFHSHHRSGRPSTQKAPGFDPLPNPRTCCSGGGREF